MERCDRFLDLISMSLDGPLSPEEQTALDAHLAQCQACRLLVQQLSQVHQDLQSWQEQEVPEGFAQGVMDRLRAMEQEKKVIPMWKRPQFRALTSVAACALLCVGLLRISPLDVGGNKPAGASLQEAGAAAAMPQAISAPEDTLIATADAAQPEGSHDLASKLHETALAQQEHSAASPSFTMASSLSDSSNAEANVKYEYPVTAESPEWDAISAKEKQAMLQIPEDILSQLTTPALIETVMEYPYLLDIFASDNTRSGIETVAGGFNGLAQLLDRPDALTCLREYWNTQEPGSSFYLCAESLIGYLDP